ncbi:putative bifunctional diguanylate cyclase/phosphodiesterase [Ovoidimarina sediminis]|uniref:putative bifunctional diguanylate cyclase/phosphodiesterase n=1 Tax=Ovoidimarina sediminis TaxID=3079856 RepID=UPI002931B5F5|nr:bifunctional diguanylate cyclase/phosphodiesterase [Rhodophyticola sp. MJ-SS7]
MTTAEAPQALSLSMETFERIVPFGVIVDAGGIVRNLGPSLQKIAGSACGVGRPVFEVFSFRKPRLLKPELVFQDVVGARITMEVQTPGNDGPVSVFGMAFNITIDGLPHVALVMTPGVNARRLIEEQGLRTCDFSAGDGSPDLLPLLAMQEEMAADSKRAAVRLKSAYDEAERIALHDTLTNLPNRRALMIELGDVAQKEPLTIVHVDLDRFKEINDTYGHAAGDAALQHAASALRSVFGDEAMCARLGGDEFVVLLRGAAQEAKLAEFGQAVVAAVSAPFQFRGEHLKIGASVGLARTISSDGLSADELMHRVDLALYEAKRSGRGCAKLYTPDMLSAHSAFQGLSADIRRGLGAHEFIAYFQPQVHAESGALVGFEALMRWNHPQHGLLSPDHFLSAARRSRLLQALDREVRRFALDKLAEWDSRELVVPKLSLNVTSEDLLNPDFSDALLWDLDARDIEPQRLVLEMVESVIFDENGTEIAEACERLVGRGATLALDDFGTGHASVLSLANLPIALVKIVRAFAAGVAEDARKRFLASSMIEMATNLGVGVLAEGVDSDEDVKTFQDMGCTLFQAFHFEQPMTADEAAACIEARGVVDFTLDRERLRA